MYHLEKDQLKKFLNALFAYFWNLPVHPMLGLFVPDIHHIVVFNAFPLLNFAWFPSNFLHYPFSVYTFKS